ncbi:MAG: hypothetical protein WA979_00740 [Pacificimonas sp.]
MGAGLVSIPFSSKRTLKMRVTLIIDSPEGTKQGSSVMEMKWTGSAPIAGSLFSGSRRLEGQAPYIQIGSDRAIFVLLTKTSTTRGLDRLVHQATEGRGIDQQLTETINRNDWENGFPELKRKRVSGVAVDEYMPAFAWVTDVNNPVSARVIERSQFGRIGIGYAFQELAFEFLPDSTPIDLDLPEHFPELARADYWFDENGNRKRPMPSMEKGTKIPSHRHFYSVGDS